MSATTESTLSSYLARYGITDPAAVQEVRSGFDMSKPLYEHYFRPGDVLYQLVRLPSFYNLNPHRGNWFGLAGLTARNVAVLHGLAGRRTHQFRVLAAFVGLEGTAGRYPLDWNKEIGGPGGATQIYVPRVLMACIQAAGPAEPW